LLSECPEAANKLAERGLFCGGCPMAQFETIEGGADAHGVDPGELIAELRGLVSKKPGVGADAPKVGANAPKVGIKDAGGK